MDGSTRHSSVPPRQVHFKRVDSEREPSEPTARNRGFSQQYLTLAKKFKISVSLKHRLKEPRYNFDADRIGCSNFQPRQDRSDQPPNSCKSLGSDSLQKLTMGFKGASKTEDKEQGHSDVKEQDNELKRSSGFQQPLVKSFKITQQYFPSKRYSLHVNSSYLHAYNSQQRPSTMFKGSENELSSFKNIYSQEQCLRIKTDDDSIRLAEQLAHHTRKLLRVIQELSCPVITPSSLVKTIKLYVLNEAQSSVVWLDSLFTEVADRRQIKQLLCLQRMALIAIVDQVSRSELTQASPSCLLSLNAIVGLYFGTVTKAYNSSIYNFQNKGHSVTKGILQQLDEQKVQMCLNLPSVHQFVSSKVCGVFSNCQNLLANLSPVLQTAGDTNINRTFYELLTRYAVYLNECDRRDPTILYTVSFFATCPSPYILKASLKRYTLVVDLDETLLHSVLVQGRFITKYRPGTTEFLRQVAEHYEIIVFTSSLQSYARQAAKNLSHISHYLFRQHVIRVSSGFLKDLSRIGRSIEKTLIVDDVGSNFKLQKENGILIPAWRDDDPNDRVLLILMPILIDMVSSKPRDIRCSLKDNRARFAKELRKAANQHKSQLQEVGLESKRLTHEESPQNTFIIDTLQTKTQQKIHISEGNRVSQTAVQQNVAEQRNHIAERGGQD